MPTKVIYDLRKIEVCKLESLTNLRILKFTSVKTKVSEDHLKVVCNVCFKNLSIKLALVTNFHNINTFYHQQFVKFSLKVKLQRYNFFSILYFKIMKEKKVRALYNFIK